MEPTPRHFQKVLDNGLLRNFTNRDQNRGGYKGDTRGLLRRVQIPIPISPYESPRDGENQPIEVPMRFEVLHRDGSTEEDEEALKKYLKDRLFEATFMVDVKAEVGEILATSPDWQANLVRLARDFHMIVTKTQDWEYWEHQCDVPTLYTHSQLLYPLRLINQHREIPLRRIKFGSIINESDRSDLPSPLAVHWEVEGGRRTEDDVKNGFSFEKDIDASFEYDRRQITIMFNNKESHPDNEEAGEFLALYKVTVNMSSIKKFAVDQRDLGNGVSRSALVLHLDFPPKIQVKLRNVGVEQKQTNGNDNQAGTSNGLVFFNKDYLKYGEYEHRLQINRGKHPGELSNRSVLHESKLLILEFDEDHIKARFDSEESSLDHLIYDIVSRLRHKTNKSVEFTCYDQIPMWEGKIWTYDKHEDRYFLEKVNPYGVEDDFDDYVHKKIKQASIRLVCHTDASIAHKFHIAQQIEPKRFRIQALLEGILQRGMDIRCQMLCDKNHWYDFVDLVCERYGSSEQRTLVVMENLLAIVSENRPHGTVMRLFEKEWNDSLSATRTTAFTKKEKEMGYTRVMKFVQTPTRLLFVGYETLMANRVLSRHSNNGTEIIRVSFRDDSGEYMRKMSCGERIINNTMRAVLIDEGIEFAGRSYVWLGNSNSQLRDHGIYMFHQDKNNPTKTARGIRKNLGNFDRLTSIPKWLARQGQCFTQARASDSPLQMADVGVVHDYIGGMSLDEEGKGKPYCFSDGVGTISFNLANDLSNEHGLPKIASAFQIRHKGQKGLLAVDPMIDKRNKLMKMMGHEESKKIFIRPSMDKFEVEESPIAGSETKLEIVKYSSASPLFLNRPMLNILSQVSEDQSAACHKRMADRIEQLLDTQLRNVIYSLYIEHRARETVKEMSFPFCIEVFSDANPIKFTSEPFLRSMLTANLRYVLNRQLNKMQIRIPSDFGRSMFGVVDTTGILQYGQIFCQYSSSTSKHMASRARKVDGSSGAAGAIILKGPVMMTKNPCIEKGDVRRFEAIDVPGLRHLVDVVVFPQHGPRPHPDEMAGSDLDGDDYSLIWDPQMLFDHNEEASLFPKGEAVEKWPIIHNADGGVDITACEYMLAKFYIEAILQEQIGVLSHAHLAISDLFGLDNKAARSLARKISQSLDFQKNGIQPEDRTTEPQEDPDDESRMIPSETAKRKPDYMEKYRDAGYESRGIMGSVFREIKRYQHAVDAGEEQIEMIPIDPDFNIEGWRKYETAVKREMETYCHGIRSLMEHYGIVSEGELMSGQIISIKNRISEKEVDDMNLYNTNQVIEEKVKREINAAREAFFSTFLHWQTELDTVDTKRRDVDEDSILCRVVRSSTRNIDNIRLKAAAAYNLCYEAANRQMQNGEQTSIVLSFPWIFYDVLSDIKMRPDPRIVRVLPEEITEHSNEPLAIALSTFIDDYCQNEANVDGYNAFKSQFEEGSIMRRSMEENDGLARASYVLVQWAKHIGGMQKDSKFNERHLVALFLQFGLGEVFVRGTRRRYIQRPSGETREHLKKGEHLLKFIDYLSSREFRTRDLLSFGDILSGALMRGEWKAFAELCIPAYLTLVTTHRIDLPMKEDKETEAFRKAAVLKEYEPRKMELPDVVIKCKLEDVRRDLMRITGCKDIQLRPLGNTSPRQDFEMIREFNNTFPSAELFVSAIGTTESFKLLNSLVISPAPSRDQASTKPYFKGIPQLVYDRLVRAAAEPPHHTSP